MNIFLNSLFRNEGGSMDFRFNFRNKYHQCASYNNRTTFFQMKESLLLFRRTSTWSLLET